MDRFFIPAKSPEDWKPLLAKPDLHWKTGYSAKALAYCWQKAQCFPDSVVDVFRSSGIALFAHVEMLIAFPEYKVPLPGGTTESQPDIFIMAKGDGKLISIAVEGKALEGFGETINEWSINKSPGKETRYNYLTDLLMLKNRNTAEIKYQLLHRTASALIQAQIFNAQAALMLVHAFSDDPQAYSDYQQFLNLFDVTNTQENSLVFAKNISGIDLYFAWVKGERKYLEV